MKDQQPVCECHNYDCRLPLDIDWDEYYKQNNKGELVSIHCQTKSSQQRRVIERHLTYTILSINPRKLSNTYTHVDNAIESAIQRATSELSYYTVHSQYDYQYTLEMRAKWIKVIDQLRETREKCAALFEIA